MSGPQFHEERCDGVWLMVDTRLETAVSLAELRYAPVVEALLDAEPGPRDTRKGAGRASTRLLDLGGGQESLHLRRALHGGVLAPLWRGGLAGIGRLRAELQVNAALLELGAPVPRPAFAIAERRGSLWRGIIATVNQPDSLDGMALLNAHPSAARLERCAVAAGHSVRRFHDLGGRHADLNVGNLLLRESDAECAAILIDLDKCSVGARTPEPRRRRELGRLARSLRKQVRDSSIIAVAQSAFARGYREDSTPLGDTLQACLSRTA